MIVFLHIPKCVGASMVELFSSMYGPYISKDRVVNSGGYMVYEGWRKKWAKQATPYSQQPLKREAGQWGKEKLNQTDCWSIGNTT